MRDQKEITETLERIKSHIDYKVGDWVETCNMLPGIVQEIDVRYDEKGDYFHDTVVVFYPHMALDPKYEQQYDGGSHCSVEHCGVHKIDPDYVRKLFSLGEKRLKALWDRMDREVRREEEMTGKPVDFTWQDYVEKEYEKFFGKD